MLIRYESVPLINHEGGASRSPREEEDDGMSASWAGIFCGFYIVFTIVAVSFLFCTKSLIVSDLTQRLVARKSMHKRSEADDAAVAAFLYILLAMGCVCVAIFFVCWGMKFLMYIGRGFRPLFGGRRSYNDGNGNDIEMQRPRARPGPSLQEIETALAIRERQQAARRAWLSTMAPSNDVRRPEPAHSNGRERTRGVNGTSSTTRYVTRDGRPIPRSIPYPALAPQYDAALRARERERRDQFVRRLRAEQEQILNLFSDNVPRDESGNRASTGDRERQPRTGGIFDVQRELRLMREERSPSREPPPYRFRES